MVGKFLMSPEIIFNLGLCSHSKKKKYDDITQLLNFFFWNGKNTSFLLSEALGSVYWTSQWTGACGQATLFGPQFAQIPQTPLSGVMLYLFHFNAVLRAKWVWETQPPCGRIDKENQFWFGIMARPGWRSERGRLGMGSTAGKACSSGLEVPPSSPTLQYAGPAAAVGQDTHGRTTEWFDTSPTWLVANSLLTIWRQ